MADDDPVREARQALDRDAALLLDVLRDPQRALRRPDPAPSRAPSSSLSSAGSSRLPGSGEGAAAPGAVGPSSGASPRAGVSGPTFQPPRPLPDGRPSARERADLVVLDMETLIRDHRARNASGMRVSDWKAAAHQAVLAALIEAEESGTRHLMHASRWILIASATVVSVGFWAAVYQIDKAYGPAASVLLGFFGLVLVGLGLDAALRRWVWRHRARVRARRWGEVRSFDGRLKRLRRYLEKSLKELEGISDEVEALKARLRDPPRPP
ncbi:hypothetical protein [Pararhodospirillum oryzae]|uniref:Uncharacterized protein n=1 Tax=Pararhodospirillum oryzae TaxID=478448 RepID=A0A512H9V4_9PROT|nr:hypothetical protein [Pararhodospirillum oryzae]GEO82229.1 hypothetical protein ROR02_23600 [Pararhodospirillum oryzae]